MGGRDRMRDRMRDRLRDRIYGCRRCFVCVCVYFPRVFVLSVSLHYIDSSSFLLLPPLPSSYASPSFAVFITLTLSLCQAVRGVSSGRGEAMLLGSVLHPKGDISQEIVR